MVRLALTGVGKKHDDKRESGSRKENISERDINRKINGEGGRSVE